MCSSLNLKFYVYHPSELWMGWCVDSKTDNLWRTVVFMGGRVRMGVVPSRESCVGVKITNFTPTIHQNFGWD